MTAVADLDVAAAPDLIPIDVGHVEDSFLAMSRASYVFVVSHATEAEAQATVRRWRKSALDYPDQDPRPRYAIVRFDPNTVEWAD